jgi:tetratricopeptide (TPR) repeat protein
MAGFQANFFFQASLDFLDTGAIMPSFSSVYISPQVRSSLHKVVQTSAHRKFWDLVLKLKEGRFDIPGLNVEKLYSKSGKLFSARMSKDMRLVFSMKRESQGNALVVHELNHHDEAYDRVERSDLLVDRLQDAGGLLPAKAEPSELEAGIESEPNPFQGQLFRVPHYLLADPDKYVQFEKSLDRYLNLSEEQEDILSLNQKAVLVQGSAGTGKTTLALFSALRLYESNPEDSVFLFTYHDELACVCRAYKVNLLEAEDGQSEGHAESGIKVFSYIDFCRNYLRRVLKKSDREQQWISKMQSIDILRQIISSKSRWARTLAAEDLYGLIYSILKGRFMPGTDSLPSGQDDYERIFRDYGRMPEAFEEMLEVFSQYQTRLEKNRQLDEADVIRLSYESLKRKALLTAEGKHLCIVIDEVQDFTELELKSILLFWENHCKQLKGSPSLPFFSGDTNQNISRSGFRWQALESYLQDILRKLHRPNSLKKVALHQNYRNTLQIYELAAFVRRLSGDTGDLGVAPVITGDKPLLVTAGDLDLIAFLREKEKGSSSENPLVVLVENDESLSLLRSELSESESVFLLPLRSSKGLEFEDVIIHRAFSAAAAICSGSAESSRLADLWYMGITRARRNLILVQSAADRRKLDELLGARQAEFRELVNELDACEGFGEFRGRRELQTPNYNVVFLERKMAQDLWEIFLAQEAAAGSSGAVSDYGKNCRQRALLLWRRCLDYSSLGRALFHLEDYGEAAVYLKRAGLLQEAAASMQSGGAYRQAGELFEELGLMDEAASCYEFAQDYLRAAKIHDQNGNWILSAQNYHSAGDLARAALSCEKAGMLRSAADIHRTRGKYQKAAELYVKVEDYAGAAEMYLRIKDKLDAARCLQKSGKLEKAIELYLALNRWGEAAQAAQEANLHGRAARLYLKAGRLQESACSFEDAGMHGRAADLYLKIKNYDRAAKLFELAGLSEKAALAYAEAGDWQKVLDHSLPGENELLEARAHEKLADYKQAAELYKRCQAFSEAAACLEKANDYTAAADLYLKANNLLPAAGCLAKIDRRMDAAKLYVVSGQIASAYELVKGANPCAGRSRDDENFKSLLAWCLESRKTAEAAQLLELKKDYAAAAEKFQESMMLDRSALCLEKCGRLAGAAAMHRQSGNLEKAADCFRKAKQWQEAGRCLEQLQKWAEAKDMYQRAGDPEGVSRCDSALNWL